MFKTLGVVPKLIPNTDFTHADKPFSQTVLFIKLLDVHRFFNWSKLRQRKWKFYITFRKNDNSAGKPRSSNCQWKLCKGLQKKFIWCNQKVREKIFLMKTSRVIVLAKCDVKLSLLLTKLWSVQKMVTCRWTSCNFIQLQWTNLY